jgi:DNA invertase Pin-like site-specific DNA recombinase
MGVYGLSYVFSNWGMKMAIHGYARVSTNGQSLADQIAALRAAGATMIYKEKVSGLRADRPQLAKMIKALDAGDVVVVSRLDRLARSTRDLLNIVDAIAKAGASFKSLADDWADTTTPHGQLMLTVLGGLAEFEHSLIKARTDAGRERAKAAGVRFGRKHKLDAYQRAEALKRLAAGEAMSAVAKSYRVSVPTIWRLQEAA